MIAATPKLLVNAARPASRPLARALLPEGSPESATRNAPAKRARNMGSEKRTPTMASSGNAANPASRATAVKISESPSLRPCLAIRKAATPRAAESNREKSVRFSGNEGHSIQSRLRMNG